MRGATLWLLLAGAVSGSALASTWSDLWATPEQQAQHLLDSRHAATAAPLFKDPRRRGYAELRAGQYAQAAKSLAPLRDADSLYNRGNALAHTGQLRDALAAYDAALKQSPGDGDIVHNRDLVARALQKQQQSANKPQGGGSGKQQGGAGQQGGGSGKQQGGAGQQGGGSGKQQGGAGQQGGASGKQQGGAAGGQQGGSGQQGQHDDASASDGNQAANRGEQQPGHDQGKQQAQTDSQAAGKSPGTSGQQDGAGDARSSPQSASTAQPEGGAAKSTTPNEAKSATPNAEMREARAAAGETQPPPPRSEQSLALDQWLRGIPDDSGELLRRKFLIEHMIKQRQGNPQ